MEVWKFEIFENKSLVSQINVNSISNIGYRYFVKAHENSSILFRGYFETQYGKVSLTIEVSPSKVQKSRRKGRETFPKFSFF